MRAELICAPDTAYTTRIVHEAIRGLRLRNCGKVVCVWGGIRKRRMREEGEKLGWRRAGLIQCTQ